MIYYNFKTLLGKCSAVRWSFWLDAALLDVTGFIPVT